MAFTGKVGLTTLRDVTEVPALLRGSSETPRLGFPIWVPAVVLLQMFIWKPVMHKQTNKQTDKQIDRQTQSLCFSIHIYYVLNSILNMSKMAVMIVCAAKILTERTCSHDCVEFERPNVDRCNQPLFLRCCLCSPLHCSACSPLRSLTHILGHIYSKRIGH